MMTNKEKYKQAFSTLHASDNISLEVKNMKKDKKYFTIKPAIAACLCTAILCGSMATAYAADLGGIQEKFHVWVHGALVDVTVKSSDENGNYEFTIKSDGETQEFGAGGVSIDDYGVETALSAEEVLEANNVEVFTDEDGTVWLYYFEKQVDITQYLENDNSCKVILMRDDKPVYFDIEPNGNDGYYQIQTSDKPTGSTSSYIILE